MAGVGGHPLHGQDDATACVAAVSWKHNVGGKHCMNERPGRNIPTLLAASVLLALAGMANAQDAGRGEAAPAGEAEPQDAEPARATDLSAVVVTGTRISNRTHAESLVPVDVI